MTQAYNEGLKKIQKKTIDDTKEFLGREVSYDNEIVELRRLRKMDEMASVQQKNADENVLKLVEEQKREKEELRRKILGAAEEIEERQALELEIERLRGAAQVMEHMERDAVTKKKMEEIIEELEGEGRIPKKKHQSTNANNQMSTYQVFLKSKHLPILFGSLIFKSCQLLRNFER